MTTPQPRELPRQLAALRQRADAAAVAAGRLPTDVKILLATKTQSAARIIEALQAGYNLIGENRVNEVVEKARELAAFAPTTHFIGHLQSNKIGQVLPLVSCIQTVDSADLASKLSNRSVDAGRVMDVFLQVNVSGEDSKSGLTPQRAPEVAAYIATLPGVRLTGYMTVGLNSPDAAAVQAGYLQLAHMRDELKLDGARQLSMGMSGDFELAIACGATMVRLGSAAFGARAVR
ncbi:YggS family pyridoxal phosphate-dependent enzyme [Nakamurella antarctica]|uniref:Pyridoxal phosphate homeostasis protein n=1 Tax=Nakamurella antarctica TaxID=1902245 RepID=A0A3G8ZN32_9ACTN|nr:YggS family pyridoxal phosphate-dependent enzyme [Nakamurella antarctica]AZI58548.1 YggS family pyridoxal phosphate-dependent enzyme [Nakamurella antarctica]